MPSRTINPRYVPQAVTVAANIASTAPTTTATALGHCIVETVTVVIPTGHAGLTGIAVVLASIHVVPYGDNAAFVLGDGTEETFELGFESDSGLTLAAYNTDQAFPHTFYLRWKVRDIERTSVTPDAVVTPITSAPSFGVG